MYLATLPGRILRENVPSWIARSCCPLLGRTKLRQLSTLPWYFCSDNNHRVLGDRLSAALTATESPFEARHIMVDDMSAEPSRAAGGEVLRDVALLELEQPARRVP